MRCKRTTIIAALATSLGLTTPLGSTTAAPKDLKIGGVAPDFELVLIDKSRVKLADLRGQVVVLNYWATWCGPCKTELPLLDLYYRKLQTKGLRVFAITTEDSLSLFRLKPLFDKMAIPSVRAVKGPYGNYPAIPYNIVIDRSGRVRYAKAGSFDLDRLNATIIPLLNEPAPVPVAD